MTGPGTNSYFVGEPGGDAWALIDPGPDDAAHVQALLAAAPGRGDAASWSRTPTRTIRPRSRR